VLRSRLRGVRLEARDEVVHPDRDSDCGAHRRRSRPGFAGRQRGTLAGGSDGDTAGITAALAKGADVNAKSRYDVTALIFAAGSGRLEAVKLLISRGADVNAQDTFYRARAAEMAITNGYCDVALHLLQNGADGDGLLAMGVQTNNEAHRQSGGLGQGLAARPAERAHARPPT
jgi:ankyrin repeat protein